MLMTQVRCLPSVRVYIDDTRQYLHHYQCPCPQGELQLRPVSPGDPLRPAGRSGSGSYEVTAFSLGQCT